MTCILEKHAYRSRCVLRCSIRYSVLASYNFREKTREIEREREGLFRIRIEARADRYAASYRQQIAFVQRARCRYVHFTAGNFAGLAPLVVLWAT